MKLPYYIIIGLLLVIGLMFVFWPDTSKPSARELELEAALERRTEAYNESERRGAKLLAKIESDSVSHKIEVQAYKDRDKKRVSEIARIKASKVVVQVRDSVPEIDSLIVAYDSLLQSKDEQIELQARYIDTLQVDISKVTDNFEERLKLQSETIADQQSIIQDQRKELRKERRNKKIAKVLVPVVAVGAFLLGGSF